MKNIKLYKANKYENSNLYKIVEDGIYTTMYENKNLLVRVLEQKIIKKLNKRGLFGLKKQKWLEIKNGTKFSSEYFETVLDGVYYYKQKNKPTIWKNAAPEKVYVLSIIFEQEPKYNENNPDDETISQYPLEDILDKYGCSCSDFYEIENEESKVYSYIEFMSNDLENIKQMKEIIGKHVYNKNVDGKIILIIE